MRRRTSSGPAPVLRAAPAPGRARAAVDVKGRARDEPGEVAGEIDGSGGDVVDMAGHAERDGSGLALEGTDSRSGDHVGGDAVHADTAAAELQGQALGQAG